MPFYFYLRSVQDLVFLASAITGFFVKYRYGLKGNMCLLFIYNLHSALIGLVFIARDWFKIIDSDLVYRFLVVSSIVHYSSLSLFILSIKKPFMKVKVVKCYVAIGITIAVFLVLFIDYRKNVYILLINNGGLFILCLFYYVRLFSSILVVQVKSDPAFWVVTGILICMCITLPIAAYRIFLCTGLPEVVVIEQNVYFLGIVGYIIMHLFFIKAYLCSTAQATK